MLPWVSRPRRRPKNRLTVGQATGLTNSELAHRTEAIVGGQAHNGQTYG